MVNIQAWLASGVESPINKVISKVKDENTLNQIREDVNDLGDSTTDIVDKGIFDNMILADTQDVVEVVKNHDDGNNKDDGMDKYSYNTKKLLIYFMILVFGVVVMTFVWINVQNKNGYESIGDTSQPVINV